MNYKSLSRFISLILWIEAGLMLPALLLSLVFHESGATNAYWQSILIIVLLGGAFFLLSRGERAGDFYEKEGFDAFIGKPINKKVLDDLISQLFGGKL